MNLDYERDEKIDPDALDVEWIAQADLTGSYCRHAADIENEVRELKIQLDVVKAELDKAIRERPEDFGVSKITETVVSNTILLQSEFQKAQSQVNKALHELDYAKSGVRSMGTKEKALENLVRLHGQQYFAGPSGPRDLSKEWEKRVKQKQVNEKIGNGMRRKK